MLITFFGFKDVFVSVLFVFSCEYCLLRTKIATFLTGFSLFNRFVMIRSLAELQSVLVVVVFFCFVSLSVEPFTVLCS